MHNIVYTVQYETSSALVICSERSRSLVQLNTYKVAMNWTSCTCCPEPSRKCWDWSCSYEAIQSAISSDNSSIKHRRRESGRTAEWEISAVFSRALCYLKLECFAEAKQDCDFALQNEPNNKKAFYRRALAHKGLKVCILPLNMPFIVIRKNVSFIFCAFYM